MGLVFAYKNAPASKEEKQPPSTITADTKTAYPGYEILHDTETDASLTEQNSTSTQALIMPKTLHTEEKKQPTLRKNAFASLIKLVGNSRSYLPRKNLGKDFKHVQRVLRANVKPAISIDGSNGQESSFAAAIYQFYHDLPPTGKFDKQTLTMMPSDPPEKTLSYEKLKRIHNHKGYIKGKEISFTAIEFGDFKMHEDCGIAFLEMFDAAKKDKIYLELSEAFRTMKQQELLYNRYQRQLAQRKKGKKVKEVLASKPGWSRHQSGIAIDIRVKSNRQSPEYKWLKQNANKFGFKETAPKEPWHWVYSSHKST